MDSFVLVMFWSCVVSVVLRAFVISASQYPRVQKFGAGTDLLSLLLNAGVGIWAAYLLWGAS